MREAWKDAEISLGVEKLKKTTCYFVRSKNQDRVTFDKKKYNLWVNWYEEMENTYGLEI